MATMRGRFNAAFDRMRAQQITPTFVTDGRAIARSEYVEAYEQAAVEAGTPGRWAGAAYEGARWRADGEQLLRVDSSGREQPFEKLWFDFPHRSPELAQVVLEAFKAEGFEVDWTNDPADCCMIKLA